VWLVLIVTKYAITGIIILYEMTMFLVKTDHGLYDYTHLYLFVTHMSIIVLVLYSLYLRKGYIVKLLTAHLFWFIHSIPILFFWGGPFPNSTMILIVINIFNISLQLLIIRYFLKRDVRQFLGIPDKNSK